MGGSINHSQSFIFSGSYHIIGSGESGLICMARVTVEKLSEQTKYMAPLMYTFGILFNVRS